MKEISIVLSSSNAYANYMFITIWSVLKYSNARTTYHFHVFHHDIDNNTRNAMINMLDERWRNQSLNFIDTNELLEGLGISLEDWGGHETCCNLLAAHALPQDEVVLALDCDLIAQQDVSELFKIELGDNLLAGVRDFDFIGQYLGGNSEYRKYYGKQMPIKKPEQYVQGGVLLMNLTALRKMFAPGELFYKTIVYPTRYDEQDILNMMCSGRILILDARWNVVHDNCGYRIKHVIKRGPQQYADEYIISRKDPWIIHYAGSQKPWNEIACDFANEFWELVKDTPLAEQLYFEQKRYVMPKRMNAFLREIYYTFIDCWYKLKNILIKSICK